MNDSDLSKVLRKILHTWLYVFKDMCRQACVQVPT